MYTGIGHSLGTDYFHIADQLTREELSYLERTRDFVDKDVLPVINGYREHPEFPWPLIRKLAKLRIVGDGIDGYGCPLRPHDDCAGTDSLNRSLSRQHNSNTSPDATGHPTRG